MRPSVGRGLVGARDGYGDLRAHPELVRYDDECGLCTSLAGWLTRRGIRIAAISAAGDLQLRDLGREHRG